MTVVGGPKLTEAQRSTALDGDTFVLDEQTAPESTDYHRGKLDGRREALEEVRALIDAELARHEAGELEWARLGGLTRGGEMPE